jgi:hypothetical protein
MEGAGRGPEVFSNLGRLVALARKADLDRDIGERQLVTRATKLGREPI